MSPLTKADITTRLRAYLDRRTMPKSLEGKPAAIAAEVESMANAIMRYAGSPLRDWWPRFEEVLVEANETRSWPTAGECAKAARSISAPSLRPAEAGDINSDAIWAKRITSGQACSEHHCWGRPGVELIRKGLISEADLEPFRKRFYFKRVDTYGEAAAREFERGAKAKWVALMAEKPGSGRPFRIPPAVSMKHMQEAAE
jgi:hypothetical protein